MLPRLLLAFTALAVACSTTACAQTTAAAAPTVITQGATLAPLDPQLARVRSALEAAERGDFDAVHYADLTRHPLYGWVEYVGLRRDIDTLSNEQAQAFLTRYDGQAVAEAFRETWLTAASRREDWPAFLAAWKPSIKGMTLRCAELNARQALNRADPQWTADAQKLWRANGKPLPAECEAPFAVLAAQGALTDDLRWQRIEAAAAEGQPAAMRSAARGLSGEDFTLANDYAAFIEGVHERALSWPKTDRSRRIASYGLAKLAKDDPTGAEAQLPQYAEALAFTEEDRGRVLYPIALWTVASYEPESAQRLNAVPASAFDDKLHEWHVREAMARSDWPAALTALRKMDAKQRADSRWQYFEARLSELAGDKAGADSLYREAARKPDFHGFLAADKLDLPYALCPWVLDDSKEAKAAVAREPALVRAIGLYQLDRSGWAVREWDELVARITPEQRRIAVDIAQQHGWFDRGVFGLGSSAPNGSPEETRLYALRFPLHHDATIRREGATHRIDPAWIAAEIRAESVFNPRARSGANALGLMQLVPATGESTAQSLGLAWGGADSLYDPDTNIILGSAHLRQLLDQYGGQPYHAIAGYNAGPTPLARWQSQRPGMDPDFWIETISYKETREYVARVLAFSVLYDWRLNGDAASVSDRMRGRFNGPRKKFACPLVVTPTPPPVPEVKSPAPPAKAAGRRRR